MSERVEHSETYWHGFGRQLAWEALGEIVRQSGESVSDVGLFMDGAAWARKVWAAEERHAWAGSPRPVHPVLDLPMGDNDANASTVREYLLALFAATWDGMKKPFGNSGWEYELHEAFVKAGLVDGTWDGDEEDGYWLDTWDNRAADRLLREAVNELTGGRS